MPLWHLQVHWMAKGAGKMFPNNLLLITCTTIFASNSRWKNTPFTSFTYHKNCSTPFPPYFRIISIHLPPPSPIPPPPPPLRAYSPGPDGQLARQVPWYTVPSGHVLEPKPLFWPCRKPPAKPCHTAGGTAGHGGARGMGSGGKWWKWRDLIEMSRNAWYEIFRMFENAC